MTQLPALLVEIADVIGLPAALKLAEAKGGQQVFIPNQVEPDHWLAQLLGLNDAQQLASYFTHETGAKGIVVPKAEALRYGRRMELVKKLLAEGRSANDIAARANLTRRDVFRKKQQLRERQQLPQLDLFADKKIDQG
ncbi:helix-turn-helix domain-containing protein [Metarhizobium album]|uniref:Helix-turn-helix domain-containing protein n=1 Tax=Metarhizobium album TaxID=2182425 RepID=A0A2U2DFN6_9HYPH|nr:helix-turn-helix domain-containing protein [Rhizobium album]PWE52136.1 helix-turn-helix domain-containing protein [Rhizobium album]